MFENLAYYLFDAVGPVPIILAGYALMGSLFVILLMIRKVRKGRRDLGRAFGVLAIGAFLCIFNFLMTMLGPDRFAKYLFAVELIGLAILWAGEGLLSWWVIKNSKNSSQRVHSLSIFSSVLVLYSTLVALITIEAAWNFMPVA